MDNFEMKINEINEKINNNLPYAIEDLNKKREEKYKDDIFQYDKENQDVEELIELFDEWKKGEFSHFEDLIQEDEEINEDEEVLEYHKEMLEFYEKLDLSDLEIEFREKENHLFTIFTFEAPCDEEDFEFISEGIYFRNFYDFDIEDLEDEENFEAIVEELSTWKDIYKSPFSNSFYSGAVSWNYKPDNCKRISDHWNFTTRFDNEIHCKTDKEPEKFVFELGIFKKDKFELRSL